MPWKGENMATDRGKAPARRKNQNAPQRPEGKERNEPRTAPGGDYYHVQINPSREFTVFRTQDVGDPGHIQRVAGQREDGSWDTVQWLVSKDDAHIQGGRLVGDTKDARDLFEKLGGEPEHQSGDLFSAVRQPRLAAKEEPMPKQKTARSKRPGKADQERQKKQSQ
jgi:hypothetical protein